jgi:hypothetical protein
MIKARKKVQVSPSASRVTPIVQMTATDKAPASTDCVNVWLGLVVMIVRRVSGVICIVSVR